MSALAYRAPARKRPHRRRRYRKYVLARSRTFGPGAVIPFGSWIYLDEPLRWAGLAAMMAGGLAVIPVAVLLAVFFLPAALRGGLVPRQWRISHRNRHGRESCKSAVISASLRRVTYAADRNRCLYCGITAAELAAMPRRIKNGIVTPRRMHVDHYVPWIAGGLTTLLNMGTLCDEHNEVKSCWYRNRRGRVWYNRAKRSPANLAMAEEITMYIRWRRWSPLRLLRAAWALG